MVYGCSYSKHSWINCSLPSETKKTLIVKPHVGIMKLNISCTAISSYLTLLPFYHNESKLNIQDQFNDNLKSYNGSNLQIWEPFILTVPNFTKADIPAVLKDTKEIPTIHLILMTYKSKKWGQIFEPRWIYLATTVPTLTIAVYYKCKKNRCRKRSAKIYRLARNRGRTIQTCASLY